MTNTSINPLSGARIEQIKVEMTEYLEDFGENLQDGPGAISAFYTSLSFSDVCCLASEALRLRKFVESVAEMANYPSLASDPSLKLVIQEALALGGIK